MPIFDLIQEADASDEVKATYAKIKERYKGFLLDIYKAFANDLEYLASMGEHMTRVLAPRAPLFARSEEMKQVQAAYCRRARSM